MTDTSDFRLPTSDFRLPTSDFRAFTLVELLVSTAILSLVFVAVMSLMNMTSHTYRRSMGQLSSFETARTAFDVMGRTLRQATLLSYVGYNDPSAPTRYELKSDLHFVCIEGSKLGSSDQYPSQAVFFQAPLGVASSAALQRTNALLSATGFFIAYGDDPLRPAMLGSKIPSKYRYRLFQFIQPREEMEVYENTIKLSTTSPSVPISNDDYVDFDWFQPDVANGRYIHPIAENVIGLFILPIFNHEVWTQYTWNSRESATRHRMPDALNIVLVAIDEQSALRLGDSATPVSLLPSGLFSSTDKFEDDLHTLEEALGNHVPELNFRIFKTTLPLSSTNTHL